MLLPEGEPYLESLAAVQQELSGKRGANLTRSHPGTLPSNRPILANLGPSSETWSAELTFAPSGAEMSGLGVRSAHTFRRVAIGDGAFRTKNEVTIPYVIDHQVRHVRMNDSRPAHVTPSWPGDSVGHYEGVMFIIDTVGIKVGAFSMADQYGTPSTNALHVVEQYRLIDGQAVTEAEQSHHHHKGRGAAEGVEPRVSIAHESFASAANHYYARPS